MNSVDSESHKTELSHVVQERAEGPKAPSPGIALGNVGKNKIALKGQKL